jgi:hypothetical protein
MNPILSHLGAVPEFAGRKFRKLGPGLLLLGRELGLTPLLDPADRTGEITRARAEQDILILAYLFISPLATDDLVAEAAKGRDAFYRQYVQPWSLSDDPTAEIGILQLTLEYLGFINRETEAAAVKVEPKPEDGDTKAPEPPPNS